MITKTKIAVLAATAFTPVVIVSSAIAQSQPASPAANSTIQQRIDQRKAERVIALDPALEKRLPAVCANAQSKVRQLQATVTEAADRRIKTSATIDSRLLIMVGKLKIGGTDPFDLEAKQRELQVKAATSEKTTAEYRQVLDDLASMDCKSDPVGFKAVLETARIYKNQLREQLAVQRNYTNNDIKNSLNEYAAGLQSRNINTQSEPTNE